MIKASINGFGRIGRIAFRIALQNFADKIEIVAINTSGSMDAEGWAHFLKYDSVYGKFDREIEVVTSAEDPEIGALIIDNKKYPLLAQRDPGRIPWKRYKVDVVIECTGAFTTEDGVKGHLHSGAKKVVISAPEKGGNPSASSGQGIGTYMLGVNEYKGEHEIVSNASCTTNCVAPIARIMQDKIGIKKSVMTTVHAVTSTQQTNDGSDKDWRRGRGALNNIIPTTTGADEAVTKAIPELAGLFQGVSLRVPVIIGSIVDFTFVASKPTSVEEVNKAFKEAAREERWKGIVAVTNEQLVSTDIIGRTESAIIDLALTRVVDGDLVKVFAWYDNEWGYATRLVEQTIKVGSINR